ncbi:phospholipase A1-II 1-like [Coffea eugenioides]|uniref:phospholipase A1-II 1-like n=1 Tax=Coffea eugenioides TaxID=49369 RepID=UPI000F60BD69|nr:phospholipase A1-II 1-like [Coffea eugenioides]
MLKGIPQRWRLLSGQDNWKNLLDPLDIDLRRYIIHYGERAQATYDTFDHEKASKYAGSSLYKPDVLFKSVGLYKRNPFKYKVVKYLYATSKTSVPDAFIVKSLSKDSVCKESNFMGYVAVATDEGKIALGRRDILVAWRGTIRNIELAKDFDFPLVPASVILGKDINAKVHKGVLSIYTSSDPQSTYNKQSARVQVLEAIKSLVEEFKKEEVSITIAGHSLGAALSTMNAADIVANGYNKTRGMPNKSCMVTAFAFGSPRVGDSNFRNAFESMNDLHLLRVRNIPDLVPQVPPIPYADVGAELQIDSRKSPYLKRNGNLEIWHNLEAAYLHAVAGTQGSKGGFHLEIKRDISLVNKILDAVKDEYLVPTGWWCLKNKGMVQQDDGSWKLEDHDRDN